MRHYRVTWEVDVEAITPREAALKAWAEMHQHVHKARIMPTLTAVSMDDNHTSKFDDAATEMLR